MSCINGVIPEELSDAYLLVICETLESNKANCENIMQYRKDAICRYEYLKISKLLISLLGLYRGSDSKWTVQRGLIGRSKRLNVDGLGSGSN